MRVHLLLAAGAAALAEATEWQYSHPVTGEVRTGSLGDIKSG